MLLRSEMNHCINGSAEYLACLIEKTSDGIQDATVRFQRILQQFDGLVFICCGSANRYANKMLFPGLLRLKLSKSLISFDFERTALCQKLVSLGFRFLLCFDQERLILAAFCLSASRSSPADSSSRIWGDILELTAAITRGFNITGEEVLETVVNYPD